MLVSILFLVVCLCISVNFNLVNLPSFGARLNHYSLYFIIFRRLPLHLPWVELLELVSPYLSPTDVFLSLF